MKTKPAKVTKTQANAVLKAVKDKYRIYLTAGYESPTLDMTWDWTGGPCVAIYWEEGPFEWALDASEDFADQFPGLLVGPINSWSLGIYPD